MQNQKEVSEYYDEYVSRQLKSGANERLISLYKRLKNLGLKRDSNLLELGCGIGIFSKVLLKTIKEGSIEAADLSEKSIETAKKINPAKNIVFKCADVVKLAPSIQPDFITLMDVLEHIPLDLHQELFNNISGYCLEHTLICINIPNPEYLRYMQLHDPAQLQIIDQPVDIQPLISKAENAGLELLFFDKYSIWEREDYHFIVLRKKKEFKLKHLADERNLAEKIAHRIARTKDRLQYNS